MKNKTLIQLLLLLVVFFVCIGFYKFFFEDKKKISISSKISQNKDDILPNGTSIISKIEYSVKDLDGNEYIIFSDYGEMDEKKPGLISLINVTAFINSKNQAQLKILSKKALYDETNHNTNFFEGVHTTYEDQSIISGRLDLSFKEKFATISNNIIYKNLNSKLLADKIEIDLITKDSKIFMYDKSDKVKIIKKN